MTQFNVYIPGTTCLHILLYIPVLLLFIKSTVYCIAHFILLHILLLIFFLFYFILTYIYIIILCYVSFFFALSIEQTCPDLHFTTDYILYNWVCDE